jgi:hypothetical protein
MYSRCRMPRLVIDKSWMTERQLAMEVEGEREKEAKRLGEEGERQMGEETQRGDSEAED